MEHAFSVSIAANYQSVAKNCASAILMSNLRNPLPALQPYAYTQNHCPDISPVQLALSGQLRPAT
jgi:hypothetical protein